MAIVNKGALKSTIILLCIGLAMVFVLLFYASSVLRNSNNTQNQTQPTVTEPTPKPVIDYRPN